MTGTSAIGSGGQQSARRRSWVPRTLAAFFLGAGVYAGLALATDVVAHADDTATATTTVDQTSTAEHPARRRPRPRTRPRPPPSRRRTTATDTVDTDTATTDPAATPGDPAATPPADAAATDAATAVQDPSRRHAPRQPTTTTDGDGDDRHDGDDHDDHDGHDDHDDRDDDRPSPRCSTADATPRPRSPRPRLPPQLLRPPLRASLPRRPSRLRTTAPCQPSTMSAASAALAGGSATRNAPAVARVATAPAYQPAATPASPRRPPRRPPRWSPAPTGEAPGGAPLAPQTRSRPRPRRQRVGAHRLRRAGCRRRFAEGRLRARPDGRAGLALRDLFAATDAAIAAPAAGSPTLSATDPATRPD